jgi:hypothetical protein
MLRPHHAWPISLRRVKLLAARRGELEEALPAGARRREDRCRRGSRPVAIARPSRRPPGPRRGTSAARPSAMRGLEAGPPLLEPRVAGAAPAHRLELAVAERPPRSSSRSPPAVRSSSSSGHAGPPSRGSCSARSAPRERAGVATSCQPGEPAARRPICSPSSPPTICPNSRKSSWSGAPARGRRRAGPRTRRAAVLGDDDLECRGPRTSTAPRATPRVDLLEVGEALLALLAQPAARSASVAARASRKRPLAWRSSRGLLGDRARASSAWRFFLSSSSARVFSLLREIISRMSSGVSCCCAAGLLVSRPAT